MRFIWNEPFWKDHTVWKDQFVRNPSTIGFLANWTRLEQPPVWKGHLDRFPDTFLCTAILITRHQTCDIRLVSGIGPTLDWQQMLTDMIACDVTPTDELTHAGTNSHEHTHSRWCPTIVWSLQENLALHLFSIEREAFLEWTNYMLNMRHYDRSRRENQDSSLMMSHLHCEDISSKGVGAAVLPFLSFHFMAIWQGIYIMHMLTIRLIRYIRILT